MSSPVPEYLKLKADKYFPVEVQAKCTRIRHDGKFTSAMVVVEIVGIDSKSRNVFDEDEYVYTYLGEGNTSRSPRDEDNQQIGDSIAYLRAIQHALDQHIDYLTIHAAKEENW